MKKILIIEDDPDILFILTQEKGYEVFCSLTGNEIEKLCKIVPDLILLDLRLTGSTRNGAEICIYFKKHPVTQYLPVILVSVLPPILKNLSI